MQHEKLEEITFGITGNAARYQINGWSNPEDSFTWSIGSRAELRLPTIPTLGDAILFIRLCPFLSLPRLSSQRLLIEIDGVLAFDGRCWGNQRLAIRFAFDKRSGEHHTLTAKFPDAARPTDYNVEDSRTLAFMWRSIEIFSLGLDETVDGQGHRKRSRYGRSPSLDQVLEIWVEAELKPWRLHPPSRLDSEFVFAHLNATTHWAAIFRFRRGRVDFISKPDHIIKDTTVYDRAQRYLQFFQSIVGRLPSDFDATICVCVADYPMRVEEVPIFAFQKSIGMETILLPDIDFLLHGFFADPKFEDHKAYSEKKLAAVFAGSTTGGEITEEIARSASLPRLRAATFFAEHERVQFHLPVIVQCTSPEAEEILRSRSFCNKPVMTWQEQCDYRFLISIDGNGAACSRLALSLLSNSVPLKYDSFERLYYFHGLTAWTHFIPISRDSDVDEAIESEATCPGRFLDIAVSGKDFASKFLSQQAIESYVVILLLKYADTFVK